MHVFKSLTTTASLSNIPSWMLVRTMLSLDLINTHSQVNYPKPKGSLVIMETFEQPSLFYIEDIKYGTL